MRTATTTLTRTNCAIRTKTTKQTGVINGFAQQLQLQLLESSQSSRSASYSNGNTKYCHVHLNTDFDLGVFNSSPVEQAGPLGRPNVRQVSCWTTFILIEQIKTATIAGRRTADLSNIRPYHWDGLMLDRSAVRLPAIVAILIYSIRMKVV